MKVSRRRGDRTATRHGRDAGAIAHDAASAPVLNRVVTLADDGRVATMPLPTEPAPGADAELRALCTGGSTQFHRALGRFRARRTDDSEMFRLIPVRSARRQELVGRHQDVGETGRRQTGGARGRVAARAGLISVRSLALGAAPRRHAPAGQGRQRSARRDHAYRAAPAGEVLLQVRGRSIRLPPRVLFVIGAAPDDPSVRAATEILVCCAASRTHSAPSTRACSSARRRSECAMRSPTSARRLSTSSVMVT